MKSTVARYFLIGLVIALILTTIVASRFNSAHQQVVSAANRKFVRAIEVAKNLPPDSCGTYHVRLILPPQGSDQQALFIVSVKESSGVMRRLISSSRQDVVQWLANETKFCEGNQKALSNFQ